MTADSLQDPRADLEFIRRLIDDSRRAVALDARPFSLWGGLVILGIGLDHLLIGSELERYSIWIWMALMVLGWAFAFFIWWRRRRGLGATTLADRVLGRLWFACWTTMFVIGFGGFFAGQIGGAALNGSLAAVLAVGYLTTGALVSSSLISRLGIAWWAVALATFFLPRTTGDMVFAGAMLLFQVIPALWLQRTWRAEAKSTGVNQS